MFDYIVFCPYFGKLPSYFNLWLNSCKYNKKIKFVVFTDDKTVKSLKLPINVEIEYVSFAEFKNMIQNKFEFAISLKTPYKLCDYKPTYGYIFEDMLGKCKYWGFCDLDMIFGDILKFFPQSSEKYDKISVLGHLSFIKNDYNLNRAFMLDSNSKINYIDILSNDYHFGFDEIGDYGINAIFLKNNFNIFNYENTIADISCARRGMSLAIYKNGTFNVDEKPRIFYFENGKIFSATFNYKLNEFERKEYSYVHFQKRKMMNFNVESEANSFAILPNGFKTIDIKKINNIVMDNYEGKIKWFFKRLKIKIKALKKRIKRKIIIKKILKNK